MNVRLAACTAVATVLLMTACERSPAVAAVPPPPVAEAQAPPAPVAPAASAEPGSARLVRVADPSHVCMVNDQDMGRPQIPVAFEGRTYFGCCKMCVEKIQNQIAVRTAIDPVTGKNVDKASAVIGRQPSGEVLYFENDASLEKYSAGG